MFTTKPVVWICDPLHKYRLISFLGNVSGFLNQTFIIGGMKIIPGFQQHGVLISGHPATGNTPFSSISN